MWGIAGIWGSRGLCSKLSHPCLNEARAASILSHLKCVFFGVSAPSRFCLVTDSAQDFNGQDDKAQARSRECTF